MILDKIAFLSPEPDEILIFYYVPGVTNDEELHRNFSMIKDHFPNNKIIALPHSLDITTMEKDQLIEFLQS